jgi:hypothetical protein
MSISNFSLSHDPNAAFLAELEGKVGEFIKERVAAFAGMASAELQKANISLLFEVEEFRMQCMKEHFRDREAQSVVSPSVSFTPRLLPSKWYAKTVFAARELKGRLSKATNSYLASRKKSSVMLERATMLSLLNKSRRSSNFLNGERTTASGFEETKLKLANIAVSKGTDGAIVRNFGTSALKRLNEANEDNEEADNCSHDSISEVEKPEFIHGCDLDERMSDADVVSLESADSDGECVLDESSASLLCLSLALLKSGARELEFNSAQLFNAFAAISSGVHSGQNSDRLAGTGRLSLKLSTDHFRGEMPAMIFYAGSLLVHPIVHRMHNSYLVMPKTPGVPLPAPRNFSVKLDIQKAPSCKPEYQPNSSVVSVTPLDNATRKFSSRLTQKYVVLEQSTSQPTVHDVDSKPVKNSIDEVRIHFDVANTSNCAFEVSTTSFVPLVNLSLARFRGCLLLEPGMHFQMNQRFGFVISEIIKSSDSLRKAQILQALQSKDLYQVHCASHDLSRLPEFFALLQQTQPTSSPLAAEEAYRDFCLDQIARADDSDLVVISTVEYLPEYNVYKMCDSCVVFGYRSQGTALDQFFHSSSPKFPSFTFGHSLFNAARKTAGQCANLIFGFFAPYDISFGFDRVTQSYFLTYMQPSAFEGSVQVCSFHHAGFQCVSFGPSTPPITSSNIHKDEGIWVSLSKLTPTMEVQAAADPVRVPFESLLMIRDDVFLIGRKCFGVAHR